MKHLANILEIFIKLGLIYPYLFCRNFVILFLSALKYLLLFLSKYKILFSVLLHIKKSIAHSIFLFYSCILLKNFFCLPLATYIIHCPAMNLTIYCSALTVLLFVCLFGYCNIKQIQFQQKFFPSLLSSLVAIGLFKSYIFLIKYSSSTITTLIFVLEII